MSARLTATERAKISAISQYSYLDEISIMFQSIAIYLDLIDDQKAAAALSLVETIAAQQSEE